MIAGYNDTYPLWLNFCFFLLVMTPLFQHTVLWDWLEDKQEGSARILYYTVLLFLTVATVVFGLLSFQIIKLF
jgi:hypothetical protein